MKDKWSWTQKEIKNSDAVLKTGIFETGCKIFLNIWRPPSDEVIYVGQRKKQQRVLR